MASGLSNIGAQTILQLAMQAASLAGSGFKLYLYDQGATPDPDDDDKTAWGTRGLAEATGGGYGEATVNRDATDFDVANRDDTSNFGFIQLKDFVFPASGSAITNARYAVLMDANVTEGSRIVFCWWDLGSAHTIPDGSSLTIQNAEIRITV